mmetsp:Transcript_17498/g.52624  ORF Transcript_17498/g.52624 Transcript_17498/m.52624 type:complete len:222 (+) Transcript_17498:733-1398(+)
MWTRCTLPRQRQGARISGPSSSPCASPSLGVEQVGPPRQMRQCAVSLLCSPFAALTGAVPASSTEEYMGICSSPPRTTCFTVSMKLPSLIRSPSLSGWPSSSTLSHMSRRLAPLFAFVGVRSTTGPLADMVDVALCHESCVWSGDGDASKGNAPPTPTGERSQLPSCGLASAPSGDRDQPSSCGRTSEPVRTKRTEGPEGCSGTTRAWWRWCSRGASLSKR